MTESATDADDLKQDLPGITLLFVSGDDLKRDLRRITLLFVRRCEGEPGERALTPGTGRGREAAAEAVVEALQEGARVTVEFLPDLGVNTSFVDAFSHNTIVYIP